LLRDAQQALCDNQLPQNSRNLPTYVRSLIAAATKARCTNINQPFTTAKSLQAFRKIADTILSTDRVQSNSV
jgi:hypothetical protein